MMPQTGVSFIISVKPEDEKKRLDFFISEKIDNCSRKIATSTIRDGRVFLNGLPKQKPAYKIRTGDTIEGTFPRPEVISCQPEPINLDILYEDNHILLINKQPGLVVHPAPGHYSGTLVNGLLAHCPDLQGIGGYLRPGIVHRLDKDTSGAIVVAKNDKAHAGLAEQFKNRVVYKKYLAVVYGNTKKQSGTITLPIGRHPTDRKKMSTNARSASRNAETGWKVKECFSGLTLLELHLKTGRTHQIRVHLAAEHHPVVGDSVYCGKKRKKKYEKLEGDLPRLVSAVKRQMLHSWQIGFTHPVTEENMFFEAPLHNDMNGFLNEVRNLCLPCD